MPSIYFENSYKLASLDQSELGTLLIGYLTFYPKETKASLKLSVLDKKFKTLAIGGERYGSTAGSRLCPYARIIALWWNNNGIVNPGMMRPGIICFFIIHRVEIKGRQNIHVFALVDWLKSSDHDFGYGNPLLFLSVWFVENFKNAGPAVILPVQRIHSKCLFILIRDL